MYQNLLIQVPELAIFFKFAKKLLGEEWITFEQTLQLKPVFQQMSDKEEFIYL